jgi:hypothetical protein
MIGAKSKEDKYLQKLDSAIKMIRCKAIIEIKERWPLRLRRVPLFEDGLQGISSYWDNNIILEMITEHRSSNYQGQSCHIRRRVLWWWYQHNQVQNHNKKLKSCDPSVPKVALTSVNHMETSKSSLGRSAVVNKKRWTKCIIRLGLSLKKSARNTPRRAQNAMRPGLLNKLQYTRKMHVQGLLPYVSV